MSDQPGCLGSVLRLFGFRAPGSTALPYRLRDDFLSPAERSFFRALASAAGEQLVVCPKVNLADIFFVLKPNENVAYRNKIDRKHVDFLLCDATSLTPRLAVELDDKSHQRGDRQARDAFVDEVFKVGGLPLLRVPTRASYDVATLASQVRQLVQPAATPPPTAAANDGAAPLCPKCGVTMVLRTASRGERAGEQFYGCVNYPKCRETASTKPDAASA